MPGEPHCPESCLVVRKDDGEELTGELVGWVLSRESFNIQGTDVVMVTEGDIKYVVIARHAEPYVVGDPKHARKHLAVSERANLSLVTGIGISRSQPVKW